MKDFFLDILENILPPLIMIALLAIPIALISLLARAAHDAHEEAYTNRQDLYTTRGILGEHELIVIDPAVNEMSGSVSGSGGYMLFMGAGSFEGSVRTQDMIQFEWLIPTGDTQITSVPYGMIIWDFSDENTTPSFEFVFSSEYLDSDIRRDVEIINYNPLFDEIEAIIIHTTRDQYNRDVSSKIAP